MLTLVFAAVVTNLPLNLELACIGQYADTETTTVSATAQSGSLQAQTSVMRPGTARVSLHGDTGRLVYPDGRARNLKVVSQDSEQVVASYERSMILFTVPWHVDINRLTGDMRVSSRLQGVAFQGACSPVSVEPKF